MAGGDRRPGAGAPNPSDPRAPVPPPQTPPESASDQGVDVCDFCRMPITGEPVAATVSGARYVFCTTACRERVENADHVSTEYHGFRKIRLGVAGLDRDLPQGIPRNSFVLLSGEAGTREDTLGAELIWRRLERGEPAGLVTFTEPPISVVQRFLDMNWNIQPALEADRLRIVDCFTARMDDPERFRRHLNDWNRHLLSVTAGRTEQVNDPSDPAEIKNKIDTVVEELDLLDRGAIHVDSLVEFGTLVQPVRAYDFIKDLRADICKGRFVPIFGGATRQPEEGEQFPHDLSYVLDGIIEFELNGSIVENTLLRRIRVRKMAGVLAITEWKAFEFTSGRGLVPFDPHEEMAKRGPTGQQDAGPEDPTDGHSY